MRELGLSHAEFAGRIGALLCALVAAAHLKLGTPLTVM
jgi:hypothetical protein